VILNPDRADDGVNRKFIDRYTRLHCCRAKRIVGRETLLVHSPFKAIEVSQLVPHPVEKPPHLLGLKALAVHGGAPIDDLTTN
jgi:hypothetical protein